MRLLAASNFVLVSVKAGCPASHPYAYDYYGDNDYCCPHDPAEDPSTDFCRDEGFNFKGIECEHEPPCENYVPEQTLAKVCPETHPHAYTYSSEFDSCCAGALETDGVFDYCFHDWDYCVHDPPCVSHPSVNSDETEEEAEPAEQTCPEHHPFNFQDSYMCCSLQPDSEGNCPDGAEGSDCNTHHPDTGIYTCADHPTAVREEVWTCPENHPFIYEDGTMCCAEQPVDEMTCNADNSGCPPRIPSLLCDDHPTAVRVEIEVDNHVGCPASRPFAYDYYGNNDYCCPHDPAQNPDTDYCIDDNDEMLGMQCEHEPPCDNHPSVVDDVKEETPAEQTCPENMPFNFQDSYMCCSLQPDAEGNCPDGAEGSNCNTHHPDTGIYTCADHPTAVRNQESSENDDVEFSTEPTCPECWQLNASKTACVIIPNSGCCEMSCDAAKMTFSFLPKMMDQDDLSHDFGVTGLTGNTGSGNYEYSHGFGSTGQVVTVDGDEMVFTVKITTEASEERMIKDVDVGGTTLILETGKKEIEVLEVEFSCRVPLVTEVESEVFTVTDDNEVKSQTLGGEKAVSLVADLKPTFSISLFKDAESSEAITSSNLKLGEVIYFSLKWSNSENDQVQYFANDCKIVDGATEVAIISETCLAGVVETKRLGARHHKTDLQYSYKSFAVDSMAVGSSRTQTIKCSLKLCLNADCHSNMKNYDSQCPSTTGFMYTKA